MACRFVKDRSLLLHKVKHEKVQVHACSCDSMQAYSRVSSARQEKSVGMLVKLPVLCRSNTASEGKEQRVVWLIEEIGVEKSDRFVRRLRLPNTLSGKDVMFVRLRSRVVKYD